MAEYAVDSTRQEMKATGIVDEVYQWVDDPATGKRKQSKAQDYHPDTGMPLWNVEVSYRAESFGRVRTVNSVVVVGASERPEIEADSPITFTNLSVRARVSRNGNTLDERWFAEAIEKHTPLKDTTPTAASTSTSSGSGKATGSRSAEAKDAA